MNAYNDFTEWLSHNLISCPFKSCTGIDCPGCGLQRSVVKLLEGDISASVDQHPAGIPMLFMIVFLLLHLKFDFKHGAKILTYTFAFSTLITLINYCYKISTGNLF